MNQAILRKQTKMKYEILIGGRTVAYELIRKNVKNINMRIYPDGKIKISASNRVPVEMIERFVRSRESFILKALERNVSLDLLPQKEGDNEVALREELKNRITEMMPDVIEAFEGYGIEPPKIKIRRMKTRWGSCNFSAKAVTINTALVNYPEVCLRFVLTHELCHLVHPNHSKEFYDMLTDIMPEWKEYKKILNGR